MTISVKGNDTVFYINPGELRTKIRIQKPARGGTGSFAPVLWTDIGNLPESDQPRCILSKWEALSGSEKWAADSVQAVGGATVTVRYDPLITEQCRIVRDESVYFIVSVNDPTQKKQWLQITVKAAVNC